MFKAPLPQIGSSLKKSPGRLNLVSLNVEEDSGKKEITDNGLGKKVMPSNMSAREESNDATNFSSIDYNGILYSNSDVQAPAGPIEVGTKAIFYLQKEEEGRGEDVHDLGATEDMSEKS